jgi:hypothetical protein
MAKAKRLFPGPAAASRRKAVMIKMDEEIRNELDVLSLTRRKSIQELGLEAICDLLKKYGRPVSLIDAFKKSAGGGRQTKAQRRPKARK